MMGLKLHELPADRGRSQKSKRVGRGEGSGLGKTAGKGHKGAQARSGRAKGGSFEGGQMPLVRRLPKFGFTNTRFREDRTEITFRDLNKFDDGTTVDMAALKAMGLVAKRIESVKVICKGTLERKLTVSLQGFSSGAKTAIEARGGRWEIVKSC
jgi:large subunit ribosomal protein L15